MFGTARIIRARLRNIGHGTDPPDPGTARHGTSLPSLPSPDQHHTIHMDMHATTNFGKQRQRRRASLEKPRCATLEKLAENTSTHTDLLNACLRLTQPYLGGVLPWRKKLVFVCRFWIFMALLGVKGVLEMIVSHRAPSSLNITPYRPIWTHFRSTFMIFTDLTFQTGKAAGIWDMSTIDSP